MRPRGRRLAGFAILALIALGASLGPVLLRTPSGDRAWAADQERLATVELSGARVLIRDMRDFRHDPDGSVRTSYVDAEYRLDEVRAVWFVLAPFATRYRALAHSFLSFEFEGDRFVAISVEARRERDESYSLLGGLTRRFELAYVIGTEEDLLGLRALRGDTLFLYPAAAGPEEAQALFRDMLERARATQEAPEFYNTLVNNCTTNLRDHVNRIAPGRLPWGWGVLLPGFSDAMALEAGLLDAPAPLEEARRRFRVDPQIRALMAGGEGRLGRALRGLDGP